MSDSADALEDDREQTEFYAEVVNAFGLLLDWSNDSMVPTRITLSTAQALGFCALHAISRLAQSTDMTVPDIISRLVQEVPVE